MFSKVAAQGALGHPEAARDLARRAIAQIAGETRNKKADQFGVRQLELYHNAEGQFYCLLEGSTKKPSAATTPPSASPAAMSKLLHDQDEKGSLLW